jgi:hypothetical protein
MGDKGTESDLAEQSEPFPAKPSGRKGDFSSKWKSHPLEISEH